MTVTTSSSSLNPCFSGTYSRRREAEVCCYPTRCLSPCFSGTYSRREDGLMNLFVGISLNPCFSGTYSRRTTCACQSFSLTVLILVLVEHTLGVVLVVLVLAGVTVLILVLVEHTLGGYIREAGRTGYPEVLILVLVEHTLGEQQHMII